MARSTLPLNAVEPSGQRTEVNATEADASSRHASDAPASLPGTILRFRIDGPLGAGGMADVFRAYDPVLERPVALKVLRAKQADDRRRRTLREARAAAALAHPNIITIYEVEEAEGVVVIAMELLEGRVLRQAMSEPVPRTTKLRWLLEMANALAAAHARGLVHRDVKPDNVFVCTNGPLKLLDFGIAKRAEPGEESEPREEREPGEHDADAAPSSMATIEGRRIGTPRYMAPEQHLGASTDARTDQHAWGLVAFELFTGRHGAAEIATLADGLASPGQNHADGERARLLAQVEGLAPPVAAVILRALQAGKSDRFPSMAPIVAVLDAALRAPSPVEASTERPSPILPAPPVATARARWPALALGAFVVVGTAAVTTGAVLRARHRPPDTAASAAPPSVPSAHFHVVNARVFTHMNAPGATDTVALFRPQGELVVFRPSAPEASTFYRERDGGLEAFSPTPALPHIEGEIIGGSIRNEPAFVLLLHGVRTTVAFWSQALSRRIPFGLISSRSFAHRFERMAAAQAFDEMYAIFTGTADGNAEDGRRVGVFAAIVATNPRSAGPTLTMRPGEELDYPSAAGLPDRLAATFTTRTGLVFTYFDRLGDPSGPLIPVTTSEPVPTILGEQRTAMLSALVLHAQGTFVYWLDRRSLGQLWVASANVAGDGFGPARVALKESFSAIQPLAVALPDGRSALFWISNRRGSQTLRAAVVLPDGTLTGTSDIATGVFRALRVVPTPTGVGVGWVDDAALTVHALTAQYP